ncbi:MAG TPA: cytochrome c [Candidatus Acidoferrum sp.]|nr:cytochrome c [Candidatus Acidoferrum sp.]
MLKQFCLIVSLSSVGTLAPWQQDPAPAAPAQETKIPEEAAKKANPVKATPAGMAQAKKLYGYDCAMCHGKSGDGQGDLAADMKLKLLDWRDPGALKDRTDGELFYIIGKGKGQMPAGEQQMKPDEIWMMVNYVRSFAAKTGEPKGKPQNQGSGTR